MRNEDIGDREMESAKREARDTRLGPARLSFVVLYPLFTVFLIASGCSSSVPRNPDTYHVGQHGWEGDTIYFRVFRTSEPTAIPSLPKIMLECQSCNLVKKPERVIFDESGIAHVFIPETRELISARLHVKGHGIDTTFIQKQRSPTEATEHFALRDPLVGRVLVNQLALLYRDTTQDSVLTDAQVGDELNIYSERGNFFVVHHPRFAEPLYLLKEAAIRLY
ncbi:MAG: hypothetical protein Q8922_12190 [Bacteroidota bacterium]|nr:hypothetical protein [Bacteroidota bacterium]MDP4233725.1 hypothetical protein [Bacteroidota bacterium]MDP4242364.1 hypothetical protein [Bacteroidota bacterium]MDP4288683.1 hypothetical protein [Bacteroidota bacterium]